MCLVVTASGASGMEDVTVLLEDPTAVALGSLSVKDPTRCSTAPLSRICPH